MFSMTEKNRPDKYVKHFLKWTLVAIELNWMAVGTLLSVTAVKLNFHRASATLQIFRF